MIEEITSGFQYWKEIIVIIGVLFTNGATFLFSRKKSGAETGKITSDIINNIYTAYDKMRASEDMLFRQKRELETKLNECLDNNGGCLDCITTIRSFLDETERTGGYKTNMEMQNAIQSLRTVVNKIN